MRRCIAFFADRSKNVPGCCSGSNQARDLPLPRIVPMPVCLIGVGSNQGDRQSRVHEACAAIGGIADCRLLKMSNLLETDPVGMASNKFLNGCLLMDTLRSPEQLMADLLDIEAVHGRRRNRTGNSSLDRSIDLDILLYGEQVIRSEFTEIPHPRMSFRRFVMEPAVEIAAEMRHPLFDASMQYLLSRIQGREKQILVAAPAPMPNGHETLLRRSDGWLSRFVDPFGNDVELDALLESANLLIEYTDPPNHHSRLWRPDYRGPRWQIGTASHPETPANLEARIRTAIQSMST